MKQIILQSVGVDISKSKFDATICLVESNHHRSFVTTDSFENNKTGFNKFTKWVRKSVDKNVAVTFLMEATGVYYENLAYYLHSIKQRVVVLLPNKVKNYGKCLNVKSKTDNIDSRIIAQMGAEQQFDLWEPPAPIYQKIRSLTRLYQDLKVQTNVYSNHLEAIHFGHFSGVESIEKTYLELIELVNMQIKMCLAELEKLVESDAELKERVEKIQTIKGVSFVTTMVVIGETFGFKDITSRKQLASYVGFDVVERQSGSSVRGKTRISKKGNGRIRAAMYMPALSACSSNERLKEFYQRVNQGKSVKKIGVIAVARKLLLLMYTIWNKNEPCYTNKVDEKMDQETMRITLPSSLGKAQKKVGNSKVAYTG